MRLSRPLLVLAAVLCTLVVADPANAQFTIGGDPRVNPSDFRITTFATGLNFPNGLARLSDGSILVATSNPNGKGTYWASSGELLRFTDSNGDGIADGPGQLMYSDPVGVWTGLAVAGNLVFIVSAKANLERIVVLKMNNGPASPYTFVGTLNFTFPANWEHKTYAMTTRPAPGGPAGTWELYFNVGSSANFDQSADTVGLSGLTTGIMQGGSIYRVTVTEAGQGATVSNLVRIAAGLRNAAGMAFHPTTGDLYFEDNGIDGLQDPNEPLSADELNRIAAANLGVIVPNFGFPSDYIDYHTGQRVGSGGVQPLAVYLPLGAFDYFPDPGDPNGSDGAESEGPSGIAFAPPSFPSYANNGVFIGFHGKFSVPPASNEENPVVFWDAGTGQYYHFIESFQLGHGDQLLTTDDSLFVADMASDGLIDTNGGTGVIYQIKRRIADTTMSASITSPAEGSTVSGTVAVGMSETGGTGTITLTLRLDSTTTPIFTTSGAAASASFNWDTSTVTPGAHTLNLTVQDGAGRTATASRNVTVQPQSPGTIKVYITQPATDGTTVSGTVWFTIWLENTAAGTKNLTLSIDGTAVATTADASNGPISIPWNSAGAGGGTHTATVSVRDAANSTGSANRTIVIAGAALGASFTSPSDSATVSGTVGVGMSETNGSGTITWTVRLDGGATPIFSTSGTANTASFNWDTSTVGAGSHQLQLTVQDGGGRTATATRNVNVAGALTASIPSPTEGATVGGTVPVSMSETGGTGTISWTLRVDGTQVFTTSGTATTASFNWDTTTLAAGAHQLQLTVQDGAGRTANATRNVTVSTVPPLTASITAPTEGATVTATTAVGMSETGGTGTMSWTLRVDGTQVFTTSGTAASASFNWDTSTVAPGAHQLQLTVQDGGGRTATATRNVTVQQQSPGTIKVYITQPATDGTTVSGTVWFTIWLENTATGTKTLTLSIDGTAVATTATTSNGPISIPWNSAGTSGGTHTATVSVRDASNNTGSANRTIVIAGGPAPLVASFTSPADGATVNGVVTIGMAETGASGTPITFTLRIDAGPPLTFSGAATTASYQWDTTALNGGPHNLSLVVTDGAGRSASVQRTVVVGSSFGALTAWFNSPDDAATLRGTVTVNMAASTGGAPDPTTFTLTVDGAQVFTTSGSATTASWVWDTTRFSNTGHQLVLTVRDGAGRTATASRSVLVDNPTASTIAVYITQPAGDGATVSGTSWFVIWIEGAAAGSKTFTLSVDGTVVATTTDTSNGPISMPWTTKGIANGSHTATVGVRDSAGGAGSANRRVNVSN